MPSTLPAVADAISGRELWGDSSLSRAVNIVVVLRCQIIRQILRRSDILAHPFVAVLFGWRAFLRKSDLHLRAVWHVNGQLDRLILDDGGDAHGRDDNGKQARAQMD